MSKVIMGNGGFYGCLIEPQGVSAWWKETAQTRVFVLSPSLLINHLNPIQTGHFWSICDWGGGGGESPSVSLEPIMLGS